MLGLRIENASNEFISAFAVSCSGGACAFWTTFELDELLESLPEDVIFSSDEICATRYELPFLKGDGAVKLSATIAKGIGARAVNFLTKAPRQVLTSPDLDKNELITFCRSEFDGHQSDLEWYAKNIDRMASISEWSIWSGLPNPENHGSEQLLLVRNSSDLGRLQGLIDEVLSDFLKSKTDPTAAKSEKSGGVRALMIDVGSELIRLSPHYS